MQACSKTPRPRNKNAGQQPTAALGQYPPPLMTISLKRRKKLNYAPHHDVQENVSTAKEGGKERAGTNDRILRSSRHAVLQRDITLIWFGI